MATANPTSESGLRRSVAKPTTDNAASENTVQVPAPSRREFLYYIWGASIVMLLGQVGAGLIWFAFPRFREGEFGGIFPVEGAEIPPQGSAPNSIPAGRMHLSNTENGLLALYGVCTHLGCLPKWVGTNTRFECPCHGSKFNLDGSYIEGPAPRGLDRFNIEIVYSDGTSIVSDGTGAPVPLDPNKQVSLVRVNTGSRVLGPSEG